MLDIFSFKTSWRPVFTSPATGLQEHIIIPALKKNGFKGRNSSRSACLQGKYFADLVIPLLKY